MVNNQNAYANYAPGNDPWYDTDMLVYTSPKSWNFPFQVNGLADPTASANLNLVVWGVTDWPQSPDHHLVVSVNGVRLADQKFDGLVEKTLKISLPGGTLQQAANTLTLTLPGDTGVQYDMVDLDKYSVTYPRVFQAVNGQLTLQCGRECLQCDQPADRERGGISAECGRAGAAGERAGTGQREQLHGQLCGDGRCCHLRGDDSGGDEYAGAGGSPRSRGRT